MGKRDRPATQHQANAALARLEMLAGVVLDAYAAEPGTSSDEPEKDVQSSPRPKVAKAQSKPKAQTQTPEPPHKVSVPADDSALAVEADGKEIPSPDAVPVYLGPRRELRDLPPPTYEGLRTAGYLETEDTLRRIWSWAKLHNADEMVWPTPTAQAQEALRFDACGWPSESTTPEEWLGMIQVRQLPSCPRALDLHTCCCLTMQTPLHVCPAVLDGAEGATDHGRAAARAQRRL